MSTKPRTQKELELELEQARASGRTPDLRPEEVDSLLDVVLSRTRESAARSTRALSEAARTISRSSATGLRRVGT